MIQADMEIGDDLPDIRTTGKCLEALKLAGFGVTLIWEKYLTLDLPLPWYLPLDKNHLSLASFLLQLQLVVSLNETWSGSWNLWELPPREVNVFKSFLEQAANGLAEGGRRGIFTPMYFFVARKPLSENQ